MINAFQVEVLNLIRNGKSNVPEIAKELGVEIVKVEVAKAVLYREACRSLYKDKWAMGDFMDDSTMLYQLRSY